MKDLNKILSGNILVQARNNILTVRQPDAATRYLADFFSEQVYEDAFKNNIYLQEELEELIIENGWWTQDEENELKQIPKDIEQMKVDYFNSFLRDNVKELIKKGIRKKQDRFEDLTKEKYQFFNYTCESLESQAYTMYILEHCTFYENGDKISLEDISIQSLYVKYNAEMLDDKEIREISKSYGWRMIWNAGRDSREIFPLPACDLTDMQKSLISWTRMYDSIHESMETPSDDIIDDNYAIDGWFTVQRRKRDDDRKESEGNKLPESAEVFVPVSNQKEAQRVHDMNTQQGKQVIKSRMKDLEEQGSLEEGQFSHVKQDLAMKANKQMFDRYKK
jgi:hypothetical protein